MAQTVSPSHPLLHNCGPASTKVREGWVGVLILGRTGEPKINPIHPESSKTSETLKHFGKHFGRGWTQLVATILLTPSHFHPLSHAYDAA